MTKIDWEKRCHELEADLSVATTRWGELVEVTASRIQQGEDSINPRPPHYVIPGMSIELIDILKAKSRVATDCWEFFLWASAGQYWFRYNTKGEAVKDLNKALTYATWLRDYVAGKP